LNKHGGLPLKCLVPSGDVCGEAAVWSPDDCALYWVDINRFLIHRYDTLSCATRSWCFDAPLAALSLTSKPGCLLIALGSHLEWWWPETNKRQQHAFRLEGWPKVRLNDGRADPLGNFWIGSMVNNVGPSGDLINGSGHEGILFRIAPDGAITQWKSGIGISNTLCWSPDGKTFYFGDTLENCIWAYDYDAVTGNISNERPFFWGYDRGLPDGSTIDSDGYLWNCRYYGGCVVRIDPQGAIDRILEMPTRNLTTAVFGGADNSTLFVTSASNEKAPQGDRLAGSVWAVETAAKGLVPNRVKMT